MYSELIELVDIFNRRLCVLTFIGFIVITLCYNNYMYTPTYVDCNVCIGTTRSCLPTLLE